MYVSLLSLVGVISDLKLKKITDMTQSTVYFMACYSKLEIIFLPHLVIAFVM